jgi:hypothetical protein
LASELPEWLGDLLKQELGKALKAGEATSGPKPSAPEVPTGGTADPTPNAHRAAAEASSFTFNSSSQSNKVEEQRKTALEAAKDNAAQNKPPSPNTSPPDQEGGQGDGSGGGKRKKGKKTPDEENEEEKEAQSERDRRKRLTEAKERTARGFGHLAGAFQEESAFAVSRETTAAAGEFSPLLGPLGKPIEGVMKFGTVIFDSLEKLRTWTRQLHEGNMQFAEFSASMAVVQGQAQLRELELRRAQGDARAESAERLSANRAEMNQQLAPFENAWANAKNELGAIIAGGVVSAFETTQLDELVVGVLRRLGLNPDNDEQGNLGDWILRHGEGRDWAMQDRPPEFNE